MEEWFRKLLESDGDHRKSQGMVQLEDGPLKSQFCDRLAPSGTQVGCGQSHQTGTACSLLRPSPAPIDSSSLFERATSEQVAGYLGPGVGIPRAELQWVGRATAGDPGCVRRVDVRGVDGPGGVDEPHRLRCG